MVAQSSLCENVVRDSRMSDDPKSRIAALNVPEFKSTIPDHFLAKLGDQERYIVSALSKTEQQNAWLILVLQGLHANAADHDVRLQKVEQWKDTLTSKWTLVLGGLALVVPVLLKALFDWALKKP